MKFIKITSLHGAIVHLNISDTKIESLVVNLTGGTFINILGAGKDEHYLVKETPEEIMKLLEEHA